MFWWDGEPKALGAAKMDIISTLPKSITAGRHSSRLTEGTSRTLLSTVRLVGLINVVLIGIYTGVAVIVKATSHG